MVNDDAKLQAALSTANAGMHEVKDYADELEWAGKFRSLGKMQGDNKVGINHSKSGNLEYC